MVKEIRIEDFDYDLPDSRIPRHPLATRDACRLLVANSSGDMIHSRFSDLPGLLRPGTLLICNDTRVINARLEFHKASGSRIEIFLLEPIDPADYVLTFQSTGKCVWNCLVGNLKRWKENPLSLKITTPSGIETTIEASRLHPTAGNAHAVEFSWNGGVTFADVVEAAGEIPIPPYLKRDTEESDSSDYQTVYADAKGSVAAPTAGLHFTPELFARLSGSGIETAKLTLHVGAGTFQPVKSETIGDHPMHTETFTVSLPLVRSIIEARQRGNDIAAVGTTSVRTLESLPILGWKIMNGDETLHVDQWEAYSSEALIADTDRALEALASRLEQEPDGTLTASTSIMIAPGFRWRIADRLITNFHQPKSTLLLLVSSFLGHDPENPRWKEIYAEALQEGYRFLSYGDACLFSKNNPEK